MKCRKESVRKDGFTVILNHVLQNETISLKAKGLYCFMQSKPDGWEFSVEGLAAQCTEGKDAIRSAVKELEQAGYLHRRQEQDKNGRFSSTTYLLFDEPVSAPDEEPLAENPTTDSPMTEKPTQVNKDLVNTPIAPKKGAAVGANHQPERFEAFWNFYPTSVHPAQSKTAARKAWDKLRADDALIANMGRYIQSMMQTREWQEGIGIPYASTMLNRIRREGLPEMPEPAETGAETANPDYALVTGEDGVKRWVRTEA